MANKTVLISGCSSGIGLHTAIACARAGHNVVATMRYTQKREALDSAAIDADVAIDVHQLDITDIASVNDCVTAVLADHGRIDSLINNAGAGFVGTLEQTSNEELQRTMDVNFVGHVNLTRAVMPAMRGNGSGQVISVTSVGGVVGQPFNDAYCAAKFATEGFMESLAPVARQFGIGLTVVEPGAVASEFIANVDDEVGHLLADTDDPYHALFSAYVERTKGAFADAQSPEDVGEFIAGVVADDDAPFRVQTSKRAEMFARMKLSDVDGSTVQGATRTWVALD